MDIHANSKVDHKELFKRIQKVRDMFEYNKKQIKQKWRRL
jgi:hypothetical protein